MQARCARTSTLAYACEHIDDDATLELHDVRNLDDEMDPQEATFRAVLSQLDSTVQCLL